MSDILSKALVALSSGKNLDHLLREILMALTRQLRANSSTFWFFDEAKGTLTLHLACIGEKVYSGNLPGALPEVPTSFPADRYRTTRKLFRERKPFVQRIRPDDPDLVDHGEWLMEQGVRTVLQLPVIMENRMIGWIPVHKTNDIPWKREDIDLARALAHQAALAIQITRLAESVQRSAAFAERERIVSQRAEELARINMQLEKEVAVRKKAERTAREQTAAINRILGFLAEEPELDPFLQKLLSAVVEQLGGCGGSLWFYFPQEEMARRKYDYRQGRVTVPERNGRDESLDAVAIGPGGMARREVLWRRTSVLKVSSRSRKLPPTQLNYLQRLGVRHLLVIPMVMGEETLGWFSIRSTAGKESLQQKVPFAEALVRQATLALQMARLAEQARLSAVLDERNRMAREIHDTLAQGLTAILIQLQAVEEFHGRDESRCRKHLLQIGELARSSLAEARRSVHALRPLALAQGDFVASVRKLIDRQRKKERIELQVEGEWPRLEPEVEDELFRILQEALANALRHAGAAKITVRLDAARPTLSLGVRDDGSGLPPESARKEGFGLPVMAERARKAGADLEILRPPEGGTFVNVSLPHPSSIQESP